MAKGGWRLEEELIVKYGNPRNDDALARALDRSVSAIKTKRTAIHYWERTFGRPYEALREPSGTSQPVEKRATSS